MIYFNWRIIFAGADAENAVKEEEDDCMVVEEDIVIMEEGITPNKRKLDDNDTGPVPPKKRAIREVTSTNEDDIIVL